VAADFYVALQELYTNVNGCFQHSRFDIPPSNPLIIFGESYAGKYVPAIAKRILENK
jgi:vitellogenic carboxypeptidase-like protein/serine carboxypeptidase 1